MRMHYRLLVLMMTLSLLPLVMTRIKRYTKIKNDFSLSKVRCDLVCQDVEKENRSECRKQCRDTEVKPGTCPNSDSPKWAEACVEACNIDSQCDGTQRCCHHGCGSSCSEPTDLLTLPGLPALPTMGEVKEKKKSTVISWSDGVGDLARAVPGKIMYLLEEQHHLGPKYEEERLCDWNFLLRTNKTKVSVKNLLKPGRWYRFRVAAVSVDGTRGFSAPSSSFTLRRGPRPPPAPKKLKVTPIKSSNGSTAIRLQWKEPKSDLPILKYKVFWSRRAKGIQKELDSVIVNHETVPEDQTHYEITDLQPNAMYFLQVQSISQYGTGKVRSDKAATFFNTTTVINHPEPLQKHNKKIKNLKLNKIVWQNNRIKARISWEPLINNDGKTRRYFINWETISCDNKPEVPKKDLSAITEESVFELYELDYSCRYKVNVNKSSSPKSKQFPSSEIVISIPDCKHFARRINGTVLHCKS